MVPTLSAAPMALAGLKVAARMALFLGDVPLQDVCRQVHRLVAEQAMVPSASGHAAAKPRVLTAQLEPGSLRLTGAAAGVGDQHHPVTEHGEGETDGSGVDMVTVANDLSLNARGLTAAGMTPPGGCGGGWGHGVVQVGRWVTPASMAALAWLIVGIGVGDGDGTLLWPGDKFRRAGQFGRDIHDADKTAAALVQLLEALKIRVLQVVGVLCAALRRRSRAPPSGCP